MTRLLLVLIAVCTVTSQAQADVRPPPNALEATNPQEQPALPSAAVEHLSLPDTCDRACAIKLLQNCDLERAQAENTRQLAEQDKPGMTFLGAAYLAIWLVLMVFFIFIALRQRRLQTELAVLRQRLAELTTPK